MYEAGDISRNINVNPCDILSAGIDMLSEWTDGRTDTSANWWHRNRYTVSIKGDTPVGRDEEDDEEARKEKKEREEKEKKRSEVEIWRYINKRGIKTKIENKIGKEEWRKYFISLLDGTQK